MAVFFGTDGIRGIVNETLTANLAYKCGNALCRAKQRPIVLIGRDTRRSGDMISLAFSSGVTSGGGDVIDLGIVPTAAVAYLTKYYKADYGVVISASHNPKEFNGIKIFGSDGYKLSERSEERLEHYFNLPILAPPAQTGHYKTDLSGKMIYQNYLIHTAPEKLSGLKIVLDCANGAGSEVAVSVFSHLKADLVVINNDLSGESINENCGSQHTGALISTVLKNGAVAGFAYDGDADRLICVDEKGGVVDGDKLLYIFAKHFKEKGVLSGDIAVGTSHTNMGIEKALKELGINMLRSDIGDKYVMEVMKKENAVIGGEQSGHMIFSNLSTTGDGILSSLQLAVLLTENKLSDLADVKLYPQTNINIKVKDKLRVLGSERLAQELKKANKLLEGAGRIVVRASGTEPIIRVFSESCDKELCDKTAKMIELIIKDIEKV